MEVVVVVVLELLSLPEEDMRGKHSSYPVFSFFRVKKIGEQKRGRKREEKIWGENFNCLLYFFSSGMICGGSNLGVLLNKVI